MKKKIFLPTMLALAILVVGILAASPVSAQNVSSNSLVKKLSQRFNLEESDVQKVFDDYKSERRADNFAFYSEKLDSLVSAGKITQDQKEVLLDKHEEMQDKMASITGLSQEERKNKKIALHEEFRAWAKSEGIDLPLMGGFMMGYKKGYQGMMQRFEE